MMQFARSSRLAKPWVAQLGTPTRFVVFCYAMGGSPVAVVVGKPDFTNAVPVRLHSAWLTGDVYGSRRCDCGEQFRLALALLEDLGGGGILYLAEEGRGLGLANKMRTYQAGIEVASRIPLEAPINARKRRYMTAKAARAGHRFDQLTASLADQSELGRVVQFEPYALPVT